MSGLSVIIPCLDAARTLGPVLDSVQGAPVDEILVIDGGSTDASRAVATDHGARVIVTGRGRGHQMHQGAAAAAGPWLLFLHADTRLAPEWRQAARDFMVVKWPFTVVQSSPFVSGLSFSFSCSERR